MVKMSEETETETRRLEEVNLDTRCQNKPLCQMRRLPDTMPFFKG